MRPWVTILLFAGCLGTTAILFIVGGPRPTGLGTTAPSNVSSDATRQNDAASAAVNSILEAGSDSERATAQTGWTLAQERDRLTDEPRIQAARRFADGEYRISVFIQCRGGTSLSYSFGAERGGRPSELRAIPSLSTGSSPLHVRLDDGAVVTTYGSFPTGEMNSAVITMLADNVAEAVRILGERTPESLRPDLPFGDRPAFVVLMGRANRMRVQLATRDGTPFVEFDQADASVQAVLSACGLGLREDGANAT